MRAYQVTAKEGYEILGIRYGATQADARAKRDDLVGLFKVKKSMVAIEETEIPVAKAELLEFINQLVTGLDIVER
jgi:hypothetical protein